jgi:hypothetical protein
MPQNIVPKLSDKPHPNLVAQTEGAKLYDVESCKAPDGSDPILAFEILDSPIRGKVGGGWTVRQVPARVAAEVLAWTAPGDPRARLATDEEAEEYRRTHGGRP